MIARIKQYIEDNRMLAAGDKVIVAVSGGPDSMALLHIMKELRQSLKITIIAAHLNHQLREEAGAEEDFVRKTCREWDVPFYSRTEAIKERAARQKKSLEEAGRDARYQFFSELMAELGADRIATAHHGDDLAETVLLHLLRGSGVKGLRGILPVSGSIIRPLLAVNRQQILDYLAQAGISYCLDQSNNDTAFLRNRIRHQLIPLLKEQFNPRIVEHLDQLAVLARDEDQVIESQCRLWWQELAEEQSREVIVLNNKKLSQLQTGLKRRIIMKALSLLAGESGWSMEDVNIVMDMSCRSGSAHVADLKKGIKVNRSYDRLVFSTFMPQIQAFCYPVNVPGEVHISETGEHYRFELVDRAGFIPDSEAVYLDYDKMGSLELRSRRPGDIFYPWGLKGHKKLKKYFIDLKIPYFARDKIPLLASGAEIYAVLGYRISRLAAVDAGTARILIIKRETVDKINK